MVHRIFKQRKVFSVILISVFALSLISTYAPAVLGTWTSDGSFGEFNGLVSPIYAVDQYYNQSVAVSPVDQSIHIAFLSDGFDMDNILYQSSKTKNLQDYAVPADYDQVSNYTTGGEAQASVANPDVAVDYNGSAHVVYEGMNGGRRYIYYTNNSQGNFTKYNRIANEAADCYNASIICTPDYKIHVFYAISGNVVYYRSDDNGTSFTGPVYTITGGNDPDAVYADVSSTETIYVVSRDGSNRMILTNGTGTTWTSWSSITYGGALGRDPKIDATGEFAAVSFWNSSGIFMFSSTGMHTFGLPTLVTATSNKDPTIFVDRHRGVTVIYSRDIGLFGPGLDMHQGIFARSGRDNGAYSIEDVIASDTTFNTVTEATSKRYPAVARYNDTIIIVYQRADYVAGEQSSWKLYINGFLNTYEDSPGAFSQIRVGDDPGGVYLFESLLLSYNTSVTYDVNITITDNATGISWTNITTLPANGGYEKKIYFYNPTEMFLSNGFYWIAISNASVASGPKLAKFWIDFTRKASYEEGDPLQYYVTEETGPNGSLSQYKIGIEWRGYLDRVDLPEGRDNQLSGLFSTTNHADIYQVKLDNSYLYNLTVSESGPNDKVEIRIYNDTARLANASSAIISFDTSQSGVAWKAFWVNHTQVGTKPYYIMILRQNYTRSFSYTVFYEEAPLTPIIIRPGAGQFFNVTSVLMQWDRSAWNAGQVHHYDLEIDTVPTFDSPDLKSIACPGETNKTYTFTTATSAWFYWHVSVTDIFLNQGPWSITRSFAVDVTPPNAPGAISLPLFQQTGSFKVNWTIPSDAPFSVKYYNVYMSTKPNVAINSLNLVTAPNTLKTNQYYTNSLSPGYYYFKITATDNAGWESAPSNEIGTVVVFGEYFNSTRQNFTVQAGDILEYEILNVISPSETGVGTPQFTFGYGSWATQFQVGDRFHFWIKDVNRLSVTPVRGDFYSKKPNLAYRLLTVEYPLVPFVASGSVDFMRDVAAAYIAALMPSENGPITSLSQVNYTGTFQYGLNVLDTFCLTFNGVQDFDGPKAVRATFAFDQSTGVLVELTTYSEVTGIGYTLKLVDGTPSFVASWKSWAPVIFLGSIMILAGVLNIIIKRVEYR